MAYSNGSELALSTLTWALVCSYSVSGGFNSSCESNAISFKELALMGHSVICLR